MCSKKRECSDKENLIKYFANKILKKNIMIWIAVAVIGLLVVQICFSIQAPYKWMEAVWEPGDLLALIGTLTLGYISIRQTAKANDMSKRLMDIETERYKMEIRPFVMVTNWEVLPVNHSDICAIPPKELYIVVGSCDFNKERVGVGLALTFQNTTAAPLLLSYKGAKFQNISFSKGTVNQGNGKLFLKSGEEKKIVFCMSEKEIEALKNIINWDFILENRFGERFQESFDTWILRIEPYSDLKDKWYCNLSVQKFSVEKSTKNNLEKSKIETKDQTEDQNGKT